MSDINRVSLRPKFSLRYPKFSLRRNFINVKTNPRIILKHNLVWQLGPKLIRCDPSLLCKCGGPWPVITDLRSLQLSHLAEAISARGLAELCLSVLIKFENLLFGMTFGSHGRTSYFCKLPVSTETMSCPAGCAKVRSGRCRRSGDPARLCRGGKRKLTESAQEFPKVSARQSPLGRVGRHGSEGPWHILTLGGDGYKR